MYIYNIYRPAFEPCPRFMWQSQVCAGCPGRSCFNHSYYGFVMNFKVVTSPRIHYAAAVSSYPVSGCTSSWSTRQRTCRQPGSRYPTAASPTYRTATSSHTWCAWTSTLQYLPPSSGAKLSSVGFTKIGAVSTQDRETDGFGHIFRSPCVK